MKFPISIVRPKRLPFSLISKRRISIKKTERKGKIGTEQERVRKNQSHTKLIGNFLILKRPIGIHTVQLTNKKEHLLGFSNTQNCCRCLQGNCARRDRNCIKNPGIAAQLVSEINEKVASNVITHALLCANEKKR